MININNLNFLYPKSNFELAIEKLEIKNSEKVVFTGPSGCGKTTLLNLCSGILLPQSGDVILDDFNFTQKRDSERRDFRINKLGFVFQTFELIDYLNVIDNITLPFRISKSLKLTEKIVERAKFLANQVGIETNLSISINNLSQGEKQRVAICRAMINEPDFIFADEPTGNLDLKNKNKVIDILLEQVSKSNATLIMVTHDKSLIDNFDREIDFNTLVKVS